MILGVMQPYLFPYLAYYQLVGHCDSFIFYDDVTYIKGGYINRNNILCAGAAQRFTLPVLKASSNTLIRDLNFSDRDCAKILKTVSQNYKKAPYFNDVFPIVEAVLNSRNRSVSVVASMSIKNVLSYLGIDRDYHFSSDIEYDSSVGAKEKLFQFCDIFGARTYCNSDGGRELYDKQDFKLNGIKLEFLVKRPVWYKQPVNCDTFVDNLSMIDVLMWNSKNEARKLLLEYDIQ